MTYQKPPEPKSAGMGVVWSNPSLPPDPTGEIIAERAQTYGDFVLQAQIAQTLKASMAASGNWAKMRPYQREALDMIAGKIARILNGDPMYRDSWEDIAGYARLVADNLK